MKVAFLVFVAIMVAALTIAWSRHRLDARGVVQSGGVREVVGLQLLSATASTADGRRYELVYADSTGTTRFSVEIDNMRWRPTAEAPFTVTTGALRRGKSSSAMPLLAALARLHGASEAAAGTESPAPRLKIDVALLGVDVAVKPEAWNVAGRYSTSEAGPWLVTKLFVPVERRDEEDEEFAEMFLGINERDGIAEFSVKDSEYWPALSKALARVF